MSRSKRGAKPPGYEYWSARHGNKHGGCYSPNGGGFQKRATHKAERREGKLASKRGDQ